jgi:hypothetical protein
MISAAMASRSTKQAETGATRSHRNAVPDEANIPRDKDETR